MDTQTYIDTPNSRGETKLHAACKRGNAKELVRLIEIGADVLSKDIEGNTPMHCLARSNHPSCIPLLVRANSKTLTKTNDDNLDPIDVAKLVGAKEFIEEAINLQSTSCALYSPRKPNPFLFEKPRQCK